MEGSMSHFEAQWYPQTGSGNSTDSEGRYDILAQSFPDYSIETPDYFLSHNPQVAVSNQYDSIFAPSSPYYTDFVLYNSGSESQSYVPTSTLQDLDVNVPANSSAGFFEEFVALPAVTETQTPAHSQLQNSEVQKPQQSQKSASSSPAEYRCPECGKKYVTKNNLQRHRRDAAHGPPTPSPLLFSASPDMQLLSGPMIPIEIQKKIMYDCPFEGCSRKGEKGFPRKDNMVQHQRLVHGANLAKRERNGKGKGVKKAYRS